MSAFDGCLDNTDGVLGACASCGCDCPGELLILLEAYCSCTVGESVLRFPEGDLRCIPGDDGREDADKLENMNGLPLADEGASWSISSSAWLDLRRFISSRRPSKREWSVDGALALDESARECNCGDPLTTFVGLGLIAGRFAESTALRAF